MKLIALFRDPLDRLASNWVMLRQRGSSRFASFAAMTEYRPADLPTELPTHVGGGNPSTSSAPTGEDVMSLAQPYESQIREYAALSGLPVEHWTTIRVLDGQVDADEQAHRYAAKAGIA